MIKVHVEKSAMTKSFDRHRNYDADYVRYSSDRLLRRRRYYVRRD